METKEMSYQKDLKHNKSVIIEKTNSNKYSDVSFVQMFIHRQYGKLVKPMSRSIADVNNVVPHISGGCETFYNTLIALAKQYVNPTNNCLDIGCATGRLTGEIGKIATQGKSAGIDFSKDMIKYAKLIINSSPGCQLHFQSPFTRTSVADYFINSWGLTNTLFETGDAQQLHFANHEFDFISCINVLHRVPNPTKVIAEITRTLKPNGYLLISNSYDWEERYTPKKYWFDNFTEQLDLEKWQLQIELDGIPWQSNTYNRKYTTAYNHIQVFRKIGQTKWDFTDLLRNMNIF